MRKLRVSAPGKAILHGEHAVVFGKTALAVSIDIRTTLTLQESDDSVIVDFPDLKKVYRWKLEELTNLRKSLGIEPCPTTSPIPADPEQLAEMLDFVSSNNNNNNNNNKVNNRNNGGECGVVAFLYIYLRLFPHLPPISIRLSSDIPIGAGLGSSAAMSVCFSGALLLYNSKNSESGCNGTGNVGQHTGNETQHSANGTQNSGNRGQHSGNGTQNSGNGGQHSGNGTQNFGNGGKHSGNGTSTNENHICATNGSDHGNQSNLDEERHPECCEKTQLVISSGTRDLISDWAFISEKIMHGTPSGIDNCVSTQGGLVEYKSGVMTPVGELAALEILLVNTQVPRDTKELVSRVRRRNQLFPKVVGPVLDSMERISQSALASLRVCAEKNMLDCQEEFSRLEDLIDINQGLLSGLGVSHPALSRVVELAASQGIHAKLTGAGGGGFAIGLITPYTPRSTVDSTRQLMEKEGFICYEATIGGEGVKAWQER